MIRLSTKARLSFPKGSTRSRKPETGAVWKLRSRRCSMLCCARRVSIQLPKTKAGLPPAPLPCWFITSDWAQLSKHLQVDFVIHGIPDTEKRPCRHCGTNGHIHMGLHIFGQGPFFEDSVLKNTRDSRFHVFVKKETLQETVSFGLDFPLRSLI